MPLYEIRQYEIRPGKMESWVKIFNEEILPYQVSKGVVVTGIFRGETDDSMFFWIRRFESEEHREKLYDAVYGDDHWKTQLTNRVGEHINRETIICSRVVPLAGSVLQ